MGRYSFFRLNLVLMLLWLASPHVQCESIKMRSTDIPSTHVPPGLFNRQPQKADKITLINSTPRANWGHSVTMRLENPSGLVEEIISHRHRPQNWRDLEVPVGPVAINLTVPPNKTVMNGYALLINANASQRHWNDFKFLHAVLHQVLGMPKANIWVADSFHKERLPDFDADGVADIAYASDKPTVRSLFEALRTQAPKDAHIFIVVNSHGDINQNGSYWIFDDETHVSPNETKEWAELIADFSATFVLEPCFSGGFVRKLTSKNHIAIAASSPLEVSWATNDMLFDEFLYHWTTALGGQNHLGGKVQSDHNNDGRISVREAFAYALRNDLSKETPIIEVFPNSGLDHLRVFTGGLGSPVRPQLLPLQ